MKYIIIILLLASCSTAKELMDKAERKDPAIVAKYARDRYPCTDLLKNDTAVIWKDTTIYIDCPDTASINPFEVIIFDTLTKVVTKTIRVPVTLPVRIQTITKWYEDLAKVKIADVEIERLRNDNEKLTISRDKWESKAAKRSKENWIWRIIASVLIIWQVYKLYRRLTTIKIR